MEKIQLVIESFNGSLEVYLFLFDILINIKTKNFWVQCKFGDIIQTVPYKPFLKEPELNGNYQIIQQGNEPIVGFANGNPYRDYKDVVIFGDHTISLYKPKSPFFVATDGVRIVKGRQFIAGNYLYALLENFKPESEGYKRYYNILKNTNCVTIHDINEQKKIGKLFSILDRIITLEQEKLDIIKNFRCFLFENILPKENEVNPNIRLSNYERNWISIDLNKCGKFLKGKGYKKEDVNYSIRASHPIILYGHLFTDYKPIIKEWNYTAVTLDDNSVYSKPGDVILPSSSTTADNSIVVASSIIKPNIILGGDINIIRTGDVHLSTLIAYIISNTYLKNKIYKTVEGITIRHLYLENLKNIKIKLPSEKKEQELICNTLLKVDNMLLLHKDKISKLHSLKQFLLNQLFM